MVPGHRKDLYQGRLQAIEERLPKTAQEQIHFSMFSIDPHTDTPVQISEYRRLNVIESDRWHVFSGSESSVQELAVVLGIKYRKVSEKDFAHSNRILVLDRTGAIIHTQDGLAADPAETVKVILEQLPRTAEE